MEKENKGEFIIYQTEDGIVQLDVRLEDGTVWLTIDQMALLFGKARSTINEHILNAFQDGELNENDSVRKIGNSDFSTKPTNYYNLDVIISVGYRVHSIVGTRFRQWATQRLHEYIVKGFTLDDRRLKGNGGGMYWKELLDRIRDIRSSEKVLYRQVLDLYATSVDYDPKTEESIRFFKIVQNKLHYAAHGHTAAEIIYERADADKPFMGLTTFEGDLPTLKDTRIAKNYLSADELKVLNNLVSGYFDFAEIQAIRHRPMYMEDYIKQLDGILSGTGEKLLQDAGSVSHQKALLKAEQEYRKYQVKTLSPVEQAYLETLKQLEKEAEHNTGNKNK
ncbi:MAG: virulence RhuM family protein [Bacteroidales bacterium]|nr:virulence RhuM family protein [Bacteroidales bacterium]